MNVLKKDVSNKIAIPIIVVAILLFILMAVVVPTLNYFPEYKASKTILRGVRALSKEVDRVKSVDFYKYKWKNGGNLEQWRINDKNVIKSFLGICRHDLYAENHNIGVSRGYDKVVFNSNSKQMTTLTILNCWLSEEQGGSRIVSRAIRSRRGEFKAFAAGVREGKYGAVRMKL